MTPIYGITEDRVKSTGSSEAVRPQTVIYDPQLTLSLPDGAAGMSALNALAHCVDAAWSRGATPISKALAIEGAASVSPTEALRSV